MKNRYNVIYENEIGVLLKTDKYDTSCKNICFVHQSSYEKFFNKRGSINYGLKIHPQYIYLYKINSQTGIEEQAKNLIIGLKDNNIEKINLIAVSYGSLIAALCSKEEIINNVAVFQAPFWGTPLANIDNWNSFNKVAKKYIEKRYNKSMYLDDLKNGLNYKWHLIDKNKIIFVYGYSTKVKGILSFHNRKYFYPEIKKITNMENDAVVPFPSKDIINDMSFKKVIYLDNLYHICTLFKKHHLFLIREVNKI